MLYRQKMNPYSKSFKNKKRLENDPENWKVFHDAP